MTTIKAFIKRHPLLTYFALAFALSWGGVLIVVGGIPGPKEQTEGLLPFAVLAMFVGPSVAGILLTGLVYGRAGLRDLLTRMTRWRVGRRRTRQSSWLSTTATVRPRWGRRRTSEGGDKTAIATRLNMRG